MTDGLEEMRGLVHDLPNQIDRGWARFGDLELDIERGDVEAVIVAGMGGSAISGDLAAAAFAGELAVPIIVVRDYRLPGSRHGKSFCATCGAALPSLQQDGDLLVVPAGALDSELALAPDAHIFCGSRAGWDRGLEALPAFSGPPLTGRREGPGSPA